jgi:hypothetical protein
MKKTIAFLSFTVILTVMAVTATAGDAIVMKGEVPFDFYVGSQLVPAGEYHFEMGRVGDATTDSITVLTTEGRVVALVTTRPGTQKDKSSSQLCFSSHNGVHFLKSVECPGYKANLKTPKQVDTIQYTVWSDPQKTIARETR